MKYDKFLNLYNESGRIIYWQWSNTIFLRCLMHLLGMLRGEVMMTPQLRDAERRSDDDASA